MNKTYWKKLLNILFIILMGIGLYVMVARSGFDLFLQSLSKISFMLSLVLITLNVLVIFLVGWRLEALLETVAPGMGSASISKINIIALASGYANIGKLNAPIKALLLKKTHNVSFSASTPVLIAEQAFDFAALMLVTLFALALSGPYVPVTFRLLSELGWNSDKVADLILAITIIGSVGLALMWIARKNIGYYTLLAARLVGLHGRVYSFESDPLNIYILNKNVTVNGYTNVILCKKVLSDETRQIRLYIAQTNMGDHRIYDQEDGRKSIVIDSVRLDDFLYIHDKSVDIIKIDIQGAEVKAFRGMHEILRRAPNLSIFCEFSPTDIKKSGDDPKKYLKILLEYGLKLYLIDEKNAQVNVISETDLLEYCTDGSTANLFCIKK